MANTAYLTEESELQEIASLSADSSSKLAERKADAQADSGDTGQDLRALNSFKESNLQNAASCEKRAQKLSDSISEMEVSIHMVRVFLSTSEAVEDLLLQSQNMLEMCRQLSDPGSRNTLAETFAEISYHIDDIVEQANISDQILASNTMPENEGGEAETGLFQEIPLALTTRALNLSVQDLSFRTDAEIIDMAMRVEHAINMVRTRRAIAGMALPVLVSRTRIAREKILYLRDERRSFTKQDKANDEFCEYSHWRWVREPIGTANQNQRDALRAVPVQEETTQQGPASTPQGLQAQNTETPVKATAAPDTKTEMLRVLPQEPQTQKTEATLGDLQTRIHNLDAPGKSDRLDSLAKELARIMGIKSYLTHWFKYEEGETGVFTQALACQAGTVFKEAAVEKYINNNEFKVLTNEYMALFESMIAQRVEGSTDQMATIDKMLKTEPGKVYATLAKACGRV